MTVAPIIVGGYGFFSLIGGVIGYVKAGSRPSLAAGTVSGLLLLWCAYGMAAGQPAAALGSAVIALALGGRFAGTWRRNRRLMPDLLMVLFSLSSLVATGLWWLGSHAPR